MKDGKRRTRWTKPRRIPRNVRYCVRRLPLEWIQEMEGLMLAHFVFRKLIQEVAEREALDPDRLSFTGSLKILRCRLPEVPKDPKNQAGRQRWFDDLLAEISEEVIPPRRLRINAR